MKVTVRTLRRAILPVAAIGAIGFAVATVQQPEAAAGDPAVAPPGPSASMASAVSAVGIVEPASETIAVATELPGVVRAVLVKPGQKVARGDALFRLDTRALEAQLSAARASLQVAEVDARDAQSKKNLFSTISDPRAISADERDRANFGAERAVAQAAFARAQVRQLQTDIARLTVRAPIAGEVLRVDVRPGEFAPAGPLTEPLISLGDTTMMHVRVQIDEEDAVRIASGARAEASARGDATKKVPLQFVRFEREALPKRNLNGGAERVDTRVIEAIYAFDPSQSTVLVGQQMDVFVEARPVVALKGTSK